MPTNEPECVDNNHGKPEPLGGEGNPGDGKGNHGKAGTHGKGVIEEPERISPPVKHFRRGSSLPSVVAQRLPGSVVSVRWEFGLK